MKLPTFTVTALLLQATFAGLSFSPAISRADTLDDIQKRHSIRIAVPKNTPPFSIGNTYKTMEGYDISVAKMVALDLGVAVELVPMSSAERIPALLEHKVDLIISNLGKTSERQKQINFSQAYAPFYLGVFGAHTLDVKTPASLGGKTIAVTKGSIEDEELSKIAPPSANIQRFATSDETVKFYLQGKASLLVAGNAIVASFTDEQAAASHLKLVLKDSPCYIGVNKNDNALMTRINMMLSTVKKNGVLNINAQRWFKAALPGSVLQLD
ncbi:transporter substrate-binding domain-containing protein [Undibacterium sp. TJN19]|uniref:transporter substrate-binding domain-containing protein n=1 Tax=Undibacterium sp. TJN19 TaxID=3413055 RepID=UPI003BF23420